MMIIVYRAHSKLRTMSKTALLIALLGIHSLDSVQAQVLYNNGASLYVQGGATLRVNGSFTINAGSNYFNNGRTVVTGNLVNNQPMSSPSTGVLSLSGTTAQTISGAAALLVKDVEVNNPNGITLGKPLIIDGVCNFMNGIITALPASNAVTFTANGTISPTNAGSNASHVNGYVIKQGNGTFTYPVGDLTNYQPIGVMLTTNAAGMQARYITGDPGNGSFLTTGAEPVALKFYNAREYWDLTPITTATGTVTTRWDSYRNVGISNIAHLKVAHKVAGAWLNEGGSGIGSLSSGSVTSASLSSWGPFTLGSISAASPLPVLLISFNGKNVTGHNFLEWQTANDQNMQSYEIQYSEDAAHFKVLQTISANRQQANTYSYLDLLERKDAAYYRMRMLNIDGSYAFSPTVRITKRVSGEQLTIYPNPAINEIELPENAVTVLPTAARITNLDGTILQTTFIQKQHQLIDVHNLPTGYYRLVVANGNSYPFLKR